MTEATPMHKNTDVHNGAPASSLLINKNGLLAIDKILEFIAESNFTPIEKSMARDFLLAPNMISKALKNYEDCGVSGEDELKLLSFFVITSRKLDRPLALITQAPAGTGKSTVQDVTLQFVPDNELVKLTTASAESFYYIDGGLEHKVLAFEELAGVNKVAHPLRVLQSAGVLTKAVTITKGSDRRMRVYEVHGPVTIMVTTTAVDVERELLSRCMIVHTDESYAHTKRIMELQRLNGTIEGLERAERKKQIVRIQQLVQSMLLPLKVMNPFANDMTFPVEGANARRDHDKYLTLIYAIALLHQFQRPIMMHTIARKTIPYINITIDDIEQANHLMGHFFGRSVGDLSPGPQALLTKLVGMLETKCAEEGVSQEFRRFTLDEYRAFTQSAASQSRKHLNTLVASGYVEEFRGKNGTPFEYILLYKPTLDAKKPFVAGLVDVETLRKKYAASTPESASVTAANAASVKTKANGGEAMPHPHTDDTSTPKPTNTAPAAPHTNGKAASKSELQTTPTPKRRRSKNINDKSQADFGLFFGDAPGGLFDQT
ncbi:MULTISPECIES: hypothetical protein [unclassified Ereboglobus]|uniref:hypothetical protein n=1 Tax=unclassified Ereboglobus TaxID=2626932 RepID=UPI002404F22D|nr:MULTISPECIES: hypothetical protein [unclassified Ereboglobus]